MYEMTTVTADDHYYFSVIFLNNMVMLSHFANGHNFYDLVNESKHNTIKSKSIFLNVISYRQLTKMTVILIV